MCIEAYRYQAGGAGVSEMWRQLLSPTQDQHIFGCRFSQLLLTMLIKHQALKFRL